MKSRHKYHLCKTCSYDFKVKCANFSYILMVYCELYLSCPRFRASKCILDCNFGYIRFISSFTYIQYMEIKECVFCKILHGNYLVIFFFFKCRIETLSSIICNFSPVTALYCSISMAERLTLRPIFTLNSHIIKIANLKRA